MSDYRHIRYTLADHVLTIALARPEIRNGFSYDMSQELIGAFTRADADDDVRAIVFTGDGPTFCAGADLSGGEKAFDYDDLPSDEDQAGNVALAIYRSMKPVIVAFNGTAVGVGITMTLPADIRIAPTTARFGFVFVRRGIVPEGASSWFLPRLVGVGKALEWNVTGRLLSAEEAARDGLVSQVVEPDEVLPTALAIARDIADNASPVALAITRQLIWTMAGASHPMDAHNLDSVAVASRGRSADAAEGVRSFLEKRPAAFVDRVSADLPPFMPWWDERVYEPPAAADTRRAPQD